MQPGYACDNDAGILFEGQAVARVVQTREEARVYHVSVVDGEVVERELPAEMLELTIRRE